MDSQNPYAPPVDTGDGHAPLPDTGGLSISDQGWNTVTSLAKWMRIVSVFFTIAGVLVALWFLVSLVQGGALSSGADIWNKVKYLMVTLMLFFSAAWIRGAAYQFYDGVLSNAESSLALGFRKLRMFLIMYGVYGLIELGENLLTLVKV